MTHTLTDDHENIVESVFRFNQIGQSSRPGINFDADRVCFYTGMQLEELCEKLGVIAAGAVSESKRAHYANLLELLNQFANEFKAGAHYGDVLRADRETLLDGDIDMAVVTLGSAMYQTPKFRDAIDAVLLANDAKFPDGVAQRDANNKIMKPAGWKPADLTPFIVQQD
jgi:predicted HAD superfamily Cof-like phosphohydrolase